MPSVPGLSEADNKELNSFFDAEQARARINSSVHTFTEMCWDKCITGSIGGRFGRGEEACLSNCVERFLDSSLYLIKQIESKQQAA